MCYSLSCSSFGFSILRFLSLERCDNLFCVFDVQDYNPNLYIYGCDVITTNRSLSVYSWDTRLLLSYRSLPRRRHSNNVWVKRSMWRRHDRNSTKIIMWSTIYIFRILSILRFFFFSVWSPFFGFWRYMCQIYRWVYKWIREDT